MRVKIYRKEETENSYYKDSEFKSPLKSMTNEITSTKVDVHCTPNKTDNLQSFNNASSNENTNNSQKERYLFNQKDSLKSPLFKNARVFKGNRSVDMTQMDTSLRRKRMISISSESDIFKLEFSSIENCNFENINFSHDLDSVIKFENSEDVLLSPMMDIGTIQEDDSLSEINKEPVTDSLSINDCEKKDPETFANSNAKFNSKRIESKPQVKRRSSRLKKLNTEEKHCLQELEKFKEWKEMPLNDIKKLMELHIKLIHEVPSQHKIEHSICHAPTRKEKILFQKHGPIRKGLYTPIEDKIIRENWEMFCELHDWNTKNVEPFLYWRHNGKYYINDVKERKKFVRFLANRLPWRTLHSVYSRFKILYRNKITYTRYTPKEDKKILTYMRNKRFDKRNKCSELAKILRRTNRSIFKRYQYLKNQTQDESNSETELSVDVKWTLPLIKKFIKTLLSVTLSEDVIELKNATLPKPIWQKMEKELNIDQNVLKTFWQHQLHLQLFSTSPIYLNDIKIQLIEYMYMKGISNTREITWSNVAKYFDGATGVFLCKVFFYLVQECNMNDSNNFADVVEHLYNTKIPEIQTASSDKFLPKIIYKNGKISLLKENEPITTADE